MASIVRTRTRLPFARRQGEHTTVNKQQQQNCKEEINSCLDACDQVRRRLQQLNSAMIKVKCDTSEQMTIRDCFFHKTK